MFALRLIRRRLFRTPVLAALCVLLFAGEAAGVGGAILAAENLGQASAQQQKELAGSAKLDLLSVSQAGFSPTQVQELQSEPFQQKLMTVATQQTFAYAKQNTDQATVATVALLENGQAGFRNVYLGSGQLPTNGGQVVVDLSVAQTLNLKLGSTFYVLGPNGQVGVTVSGITKTTPGGSEFLQNGIWDTSQADPGLIPTSITAIAVQVSSAQEVNFENRAEEIIGSDGRIVDTSTLAGGKNNLLLVMVLIGAVALLLVGVVGISGISGLLSKVSEREDRFLFGLGVDRWRLSLYSAGQIGIPGLIGSLMALLPAELLGGVISRGMGLTNVHVTAADLILEGVVTLVTIAMGVAIGGQLINPKASFWKKAVGGVCLLLLVLLLCGANSILGWICVGAGALIIIMMVIWISRGWLAGIFGRVSGRLFRTNGLAQLRVQRGGLGQVAWLALASTLAFGIFTLNQGLQGATTHYVHEVFPGDAVVSSPATQTQAVFTAFQAEPGIGKASPITTGTVYEKGGQTLGAASIQASFYEEFGGPQVIQGKNVWQKVGDGEGVVLPASLYNGQKGIDLWNGTAYVSEPVVGVIDHSLPVLGSEAVLMGGNLGQKLLGTGVNLIQVELAPGATLIDGGTAANQFGMEMKSVDQIATQTLNQLGAAVGSLVILSLLAFGILLLLVVGAQAAQIQRSGRSFGLLRMAGMSRLGAWRFASAEVLLEGVSGLFLGGVMGVALGNLLTLWTAGEIPGGIFLPWELLAWIFLLLPIALLVSLALAGRRIWSLRVRRALMG